MHYIYLLMAIFCEVLGTMLLPASKNFTKPLPTFILTISYCLAFYFLTHATKKISLGIVYASWSGIGIFSITILSYFIYKQSLEWQSLIGLILVIVGVTIVNIYK